MLELAKALGATALVRSDVPMSAQTYQLLSRLIYKHSRIHLGPNKQALLTSRLAKHKRDLSLASWENYAAWIAQDQSDGIDTLIDLISTNHTQFFREKIHFDLLSTSLIGQLLNRCESAHSGLRCWSAACSSGEEPYSLAMVLCEYVEQQNPGLRWQIDATDISYRALNKAKEGVYDIRRLALPDPAWLHKYFQQGSGPFEGFCKIKGHVREKMNFLQMNLFADRKPALSRQHIIFCRNVLIYFELASQAQLIQKLYEALEPGGLLIVGHSDSLLRIQHAFKGLGNGVYQRVQ